MGLLEDGDKNIHRRYQELCSNLNMDKETAEQAWESYEAIRQNYSLEGDQLHWLGCALYVACRRSSTPAVGRSGTVVEGNCVSLTRLLRLCKLSLIQFFNKSKKWADMANMPPEFRNKIDRLERNFAVSMVIFKKFQPIFMELFQNPINPDRPRQSTSRKPRSLPCTPAKLFDFAWTLFICVKGQFPAASDDLVNSYHLLLSCCDLVYANALCADRRDLLNTQYKGIPENFWEVDYTPPSKPLCIVDALCKSQDGIPVEAKGIKEYCWKNHIKKLFDEKKLKGDLSTFTGILDPNNFESNFKNINNTYEEHVLSVGDFDERIFLGEDANADIGTPTKLCGLGDIAEKLQARKNNLQQFEGIHQLTPSTPLTGRKYLKSKEVAHANITPVSTATQSVSRLQALLSDRQASPSDALVNIFQSCSRNPQEKVQTLIKELGDQFCSNYTRQSDDVAVSNIDFARKRLQLGESLYYKLLENILLEEKKRKPADFDLSNLLENETFHQSLFACSLEIVIYSYNSQRTFPWILESLNLWPCHFYKVIEPIVRVEDQLSRDMVKHLNHIEERILEEMAWKSDSPLWEQIKNSGLAVPSCEDVFPPGQLDESQGGSETSGRRTTNTDRNLIRPFVLATGAPQSPVTSVSERFQSPVSANSLAKKRLFQTSDGVPVTATVVQRQVKPGQSLLQQSKVINIQSLEGENGQRYNPIFYVPGTGSVIIQTQPTVQRQHAVATVTAPPKEQKAKRADSLGLFFRKFYSLASVRMQELCGHLELNESDLRKKIWTCFEHSIITQTELMKDRHLDQILMCAVYVICRVAKSEKTFTEIMRCYRRQPQAASHVYRSVLLNNKRRRNNPNASADKKAVGGKDEQSKDGSLPAAEQSSAPPTPTRLACSSTSFEFEERGDLIKFYNTVYVPMVKEFAVKFTSVGTQPDNLTLSPIPVGKNQPMSPYRRISEKYPVYIRSLEQKSVSSSPSQQLRSYCFSRSPPKDLRAINNMIRDTRKVGKRLLADDGNDEEDSSPAKQPAPAVVTRKLQNLLGDRMGQTQD